MKSISLIALLSLLMLSLAGCMSDAQLKEKMKKALVSDPEILTEAIKANPAKIMMAIQSAAQNAQAEMAKMRDEEERKQVEEYFNTPLKPNIRDDEAIRGTKGAPIVLVEYSDYQCPYCSKAFTSVVVEMLKKYEGKIQFIYKHLPLSFHDKAKISSQYYEAIRLQSAEKAFKFHDELYNNQGKLSLGESFLKKAASSLGVDMGKLAKDINSKEVLDRIEQDEKEAAEFGFQGTPGFILNGIPIKGAYPLSYFEDLITKLKEKGKISL
ncbi:MAG: thiol:disulfide interchange protein [Bdellovibrionales bacterium RIFOXYD12_FULL_39_22]|nr:MAG: thiol:disulfide interchange protein [Bdellovibrionales bacterium RIFOXYB1_FULL_39_21]OFZ42845.1 MAG: thiol:disulfide interchange protein [Bdellovibrionales bacterium RIFOXYC12_FULL_39_17]OFZ47495.1 MAG: thiol:disulfide interchange protein [Bdellovibrionales bacterium RIFOXYC1_FULL_39_130]OFZ69727.1 MAG: thiol:disulfide interchange protein [Bdellovibrionales bacterium RIFOXYC2_FULL_39_8]OFZ75583.1 MAG: thiol:disulfide interchange protein [Bdellovibrionales bacterium RIFOXYD1_FULL_39_84]